MEKLDSISMDMDISFENAVNEKDWHVPHLVDPVRLIALATRRLIRPDAVLGVKSDTWSQSDLGGRPRLAEARLHDQARWTKHTRWAPLDDLAKVYSFKSYSM